MDSPFLHQWVLEHALATPNAPAIVSTAGRLTYGDLAERARVLAGDLERAGIGRGDRVLVVLPNVPAFIVAGLAIHLRGAVSVEVSRDWRPELLADVAARSHVRAAIFGRRDLATWRTVFGVDPIDDVWIVHGAPGGADAGDGVPGRRVHVLLEDGRLDAPGRDPSREVVPVDPDDPALVLFTSGSTGRPHGVVQTFRNIDANTRSIVQYLGLGSGDRAMLTLPLSYCYGRSVLQTHLFVGGSVVLDNRMAFPRRVLEAIGAERCTGFAGVPLTFELIRRQVDVSTIDLPDLRYVTQAGGAMAPDTIAWAREAFASAGLFIMYGQTEATARLSYLAPDRALDKPGSIGVPIPGVELRVVNEDGNEVLPGEVGELIARGDNVTRGYLDEPEENARLLRDGWLWTGDLASRDEEGFLYLKGRSREILKIGGRRISPTEIEQVLDRLPGVVESAVVATPDELLGEAPIAFVVKAPGSTLGEDELVRACRESLPIQLVPRKFIFVESLPRSESGKLLRADLARRVDVGR